MNASDIADCSAIVLYSPEPIRRLPPWQLGAVWDSLRRCWVVWVEACGFDSPGGRKLLAELLNQCRDMGFHIYDQDRLNRDSEGDQQ